MVDESETGRPRECETFMFTSGRHGIELYILSVVGEYFLLFTKNNLNKHDISGEWGHWI